MAVKVVCVKVGFRVTQVAEMDYGVKNPKVHQVFSFETPEGALDDSGVHVSDSLVSRIRKGMKRAGIKSRRVVFAITSARVATREVTIPMVKEKKIKSILIANSREYFPVDMSEFQLVYRIIEKQKAEEQIKLLVFAVPNSLVQSYVLLAKALGMQLTAVDYLGNSIYQAMIRDMSTDIAATICIDDNNSLVTVIRDGQIALQRTIGHGIDDAVRLLTEGEFARDGMSYLDALDLMRHEQYISDELHPKQDDEMKVRKGITGALTVLVNNISRVLDYYFSRNSDVELARITLVGLGADCLGLDLLLSNELDVCVETVRKSAEYYSCTGAALEPLPFSFDDKSDGILSPALRLPMAVFAGCVGISAVLLASQFAQNRMLEMENEGKVAQIESKRAAIDTYNDYVTKKMINQELVTINDCSRTANEIFLEFLAELEESAPRDLVVANITATDDQVAMTLTCNSMASAADALIQIRSFRTVSVLSCSGLTETVGEDGAKQVEFSVSLTYNYEGTD